MAASEPTIIASSIGFTGLGLGPMDWEAGPVYRLAAEYARTSSAPRLCIIDTAEGDNPASLTAMYAAFGRRGFVVSHLALFPQPNVADVGGFLRAQDVIWVAGGSVANLLALWRLHGLRDALHGAWQSGVVLCGVSAGSLCWFVGGTTDSFGPRLRPVFDGLGFLPYSNSPHHDAEEQRRPAITGLVGAGALPDCYATDNGSAVVFRGTRFEEAVSEREGARAWLLRRDGGGVVESPLPTRILEPWPRGERFGA
ncbi:Type 1 glutamine amidotransferase-like domain-containing protein [Microbacterium phosphatis]|uniref:Type 1 glutamine amidotransferase-like domain-containing protein n=1 Tax=Microbacterium phosphatis TaxID=3140248 RepID=UPI003140177B